MEARIRAALESRELIQLEEAEALAETMEDISEGLLQEIHEAHTISRFEHDLYDTTLLSLCFCNIWSGLLRSTGRTSTH